MKFSATVPLQYDTVFSPYQASEWLKGLDWICDSGLDGAELCISHYENIDLNRIKEQLDQRGLECSTISTGQARGLEGLSLIGVSSELCKKTQDRFKQHIDAASILKSKVTVGLMRGIGSAQTSTKDLAQLREAMLPLVDYADKKGVVLCLEAINRYETALLNSAQATLDFVQNTLGDPDCVGVLWDLFHANIEDQSFDQSICLLGDKLQHVHLADSNRMFPGYGHLDFASILGQLKARGFSNYCSFECLNQPTLEIVLKETGPWVESMRK